MEEIHLYMMDETCKALKIILKLFRCWKDMYIFEIHGKQI